MALEGKKILMVLPPRGFADQAYERPRRIFESQGAKVTIASTQLGRARGEKGMMVPVDVRIEDVKYYDYDAIVFVGGKGADEYLEHEKIVKLAKDAEYKVLGAIDNAAGILAKAEIIKDKRLTGALSVARLINEKKGTYTAQPIEVSEKIVTARDAAYAEAFANAVVKTMQK